LTRVTHAYIRRVLLRVLEQLFQCSSSCARRDCHLLRPEHDAALAGECCEGNGPRKQRRPPRHLMDKPATKVRQGPTKRPHPGRRAYIGRVGGTRRALRIPIRRSIFFLKDEKGCSGKCRPFPFPPASFVTNSAPHAASGGSACHAPRATEGPRRQRRGRSREETRLNSSWRTLTSPAVGHATGVGGRAWD